MGIIKKNPPNCDIAFLQVALDFFFCPHMIKIHLKIIMLVLTWKIYWSIMIDRWTKFAYVSPSDSWFETNAVSHNLLPSRT
jgi:hypothetical protein